MKTCRETPVLVKMWQKSDNLNECLITFYCYLLDKLTITAFFYYNIFLYCWQWHLTQQYPREALLLFQCNSGYANVLLNYVIVHWLSFLCYSKWYIYIYMYIYILPCVCVVKGPAADAPQPWGLLCNPVMKMLMDSFFFLFLCNGAPVQWIWQGKTEVLGEKTYPSATLSTTNPTWTDPGSNPGLRCEWPATNRLSHGTTYDFLVL
jgi:hypothetical protein